MTKILVVDDDPSGTNLLITLLGLEGYQAIKLEDWADPIKDIAHEKPDVVLMDVRLMALDGIEILRRVRAHRDRAISCTPVLMMSAEDLSSRCHAAGANAFIEKPFECARLLEQIERVMEGSIEES